MQNKITRIKFNSSDPRIPVASLISIAQQVYAKKKLGI